MRFRLALLGILFAVPLAALDLGAAIPDADVKMKNVDGREISIAEVAGKQGTLVVFTCNHCPFVKAWEKRIAALGNEYAGKGIGVIAVNANDPKANANDGFDGMVERAKMLDLAFPYVVDQGSKVAKAFGAERTPEAFLFDAQGALVYHGTIDDNAEDAAKVTKPYLADALAAVAAGQPVDTKETKALGCTIKFYES